MKKKFIVEWSRPSSVGENGFKTKIVREQTVKTVFGDKVAKETYYVRGTIQFEEGVEIEVNMAQFEAVAYPTPMEDGTIVPMKWLHVKAA
jgi:hypothetical protein